MGLFLQSFVLFLFHLEILLIDRDAELARLLAVLDAVHSHGMVPPRFAVLLVLDIQSNHITVQLSLVVCRRPNVAGAGRGSVEVQVLILSRDGRARKQ